MNLSALGAATNGLQHLRNYTRLHIAQANDEGVYTPTTGPRPPLDRTTVSRPSSTSSDGATSSDLSGTAQALQALQDLAENDPARLQEVAGLIATKLREAASSVEDGSQLNNIADAFQAVADGAPLDDVIPALSAAATGPDSAIASSTGSLDGTGSVSAYDLLGKIIASSIHRAS